MSKKPDQKSSTRTSFKKTLLSQIEGKLSESLKEYSKKLSEKRYRKTIHKAGKILIKSLQINPVKESSKTELKKSKKIKPEAAT